MQAAIAANDTRAGVDCVAERHLGPQDNFSLSEVGADPSRPMVRERLSGPAAQRPEAIAMLRTNLRGAPLAEALDDEFGLPVHDRIAAVLWNSLPLAAVDTRRVTGWGRLFRDLA